MVLEIIIQELDQLRSIRFLLATFLAAVHGINKFARLPFYFGETDHPNVNVLDFLVEMFDNVTVKNQLLEN
jgi:hypothetical protein